eukprot:s469_g37.t1
MALLRPSRIKPICGLDVTHYSGLLEDSGLLPKPHAFLHRAEAPKSRKVLKSTALAALPPFLLNQVLQWRADAMMMAAARLGIVAGGSAHAAVEAIAKAQDWKLRAGHVKRLYRWAQSRPGRAALQRSQRFGIGTC